MRSDQFIGTWKLVTSEFRRSDGTIIYPYGQDALGILTYDAAGNMIVQLMRADRPAFVSGDLYNGTPEEIQAAYEGAFAYFGRYDRPLERGAVGGGTGDVRAHSCQGADAGLPNLARARPLGLANGRDGLPMIQNNCVQGLVVCTAGGLYERAEVQATIVAPEQR